MYEITVEDDFSAAHRLREYDGNCERLHGHNWKVQVTFEARSLDNRGLGIDFRLARRLLAEALQALDHTSLNEIDPFRTMNPSCENISRHLFETIAGRLAGEIDQAGDVRVSKVRIWESERSFVTFRGGPGDD